MNAIQPTQCTVGYPVYLPQKLHVLNLELAIQAIHKHHRSQEIIRCFKLSSHLINISAQAMQTHYR